MNDAASLIATAAAAQKPPAIAPHLDLAAAQKAGRDFAAYFLSQMFENMFAGVGTDALFGGGPSENIYRSMLIDQYSKVAAQNGTNGIAAEVTRAILQMQERQRS